MLAYNKLKTKISKDPTNPTTKASEKESFGEMLSWNMLAAGILPHTLDNRCLRWDSVKGLEKH